jgi:hypothetical protein
VYELAGACGIDPQPYELWELRAMASAAWDHTAFLVATVQGLVSKSASVDKANPYRYQAVESGGGDFVGKLNQAKGKLKKWIPPT